MATSAETVHTLHTLHARQKVTIEGLLIWTYRYHYAHAISASRQSLNDSAPRIAALAVSAVSETLAVSESMAATSDDPSSVPGNQFTDRGEVMPWDARVVHGTVMALPEESRNRVILQAVRGKPPSDGSDVPDHEWAPVYARDGKRVEWHSGEFEEVDAPPQGLKPGEGYWLLVPRPHSHRTAWLVRRAKPMPYNRVTESKRRRYLAVRDVDRLSRVVAAKHRYKVWWDALVAVRWFVAPLLAAHELTDVPPPPPVSAIEMSCFTTFGLPRRLLFDPACYSLHTPRVAFGELRAHCAL